MPATAGSTVYFAESIEKVPDNLKEARPTVFFGVPRIWEKFHAGSPASSARPPAPRSSSLDWARGVCTAGQRASAIAASRCPRCSTLQYRLARPARDLEAQDRARLRPRAAPVSPAPRRSRPRCSSSSRASIFRSARSTASRRTPGPTSFNLPGRTQARHRRPAAPRPRGQDRRRRRDPGPRPERVPRLLQGARGHRRGAARRLAVLGRPRARSTATASCRSPAARRRSSSPPAARTSRRRTSRRRSSNRRWSPRRW